MTTNEEKIILPDSDEAAQIGTVTGWVSRTGRFFGKDEDLARYAGSTHKVCKCGSILKKADYCKICAKKIALEKLLSYPLVEYNGDLVVYSDDFDKYFFDEESLIDYIEEEYFQFEEAAPTTFNLQVCYPQPYHIVESDYWEDILPEDGEIHDDLSKALDELNAVIAKLPPASWFPGKQRTEYHYKPQESNATH